jgi:hypothetical protein
LGRHGVTMVDTPGREGWFTVAACRSVLFYVACSVVPQQLLRNCTRLCLYTALHLFPVGVLLVSAVQVDLHHHQVPSLRIGGSSCLEN